MNAIASERARLGMSQDDLAQKVGKGRGTIIRWEANPASISGNYLIQLAALFGCSIDYLLGLTSERVPRTA